MKVFIMGVLLISSFSSFASVGDDCSFMKGLSIGAKALTAYGTSDHYYTNREHSGAVHGTKRRQILLFTEQVMAEAMDLTQHKELVYENAAKLRAAAKDVYVGDVSVYERGIDNMDNALKKFAENLIQACK